MATTHRTVEDFFITLRYAENLARGLGFVYNPGEHVLGTTTPLYTLFLALVARLGLDPILWGKLLNIVADGVSCLLIYRLGRAVGRPEAGMMAAALLVAWPPDLYWAISGMETALVTMAGLAVFVSLVERRPLWMAFWAALLVLLRIDGLLLALIAFAALLLPELMPGRSLTPHASRLTPEGSAATAHASRLTPGICAILLFLVLLLPWTLFAFAYFGSPIPTSLLAKLSVYSWQSKSMFPNLRPLAHQMAHNAFYALFMLGILPGLWLAARHIPALRPAVAWMVLYYAGMAFSKGFLFGWYFVPPAPMFVLLCVVGWSAALQTVWKTLSRRRFDATADSGGLGGASPAPTCRPADSGGQPCRPADSGGSGALIHQGQGRRPSPFSPLQPYWVAALLLLVGMGTVPRQRAMIVTDQRQEQGLLKPVGLALREIVKPDQRLMLEPIGWIGYYSGARVLDAVGLVSPEIIPYFRKGAVSPYLDIMANLKPDYVLLRAGEYHEALTALVPPDRALFSHYDLVREFPDPGAPPGHGAAFFLLRRR